MSEMSHPPILREVGPSISDAQIFFEEAYMMLSLVGIPLDEEIKQIELNNEVLAPVIVTSLVTERVDLVSENNDRSVAMRLRTMPVVRQVLPGYSKMDPSEESLAILVEYGESEGDYSDPDFDDSLNWRAYVLAVMDVTGNDKFSVLNAQTGEELEPDDVKLALKYLEQMRVEMRNLKFEEQVIEDTIATGYRDPTSPLASTQPMELAKLLVNSQAPYNYN